jgi:hypothetical protein
VIVEVFVGVVEDCEEIEVVVEEITAALIDCRTMIERRKIAKIIIFLS